MMISILLKLLLVTSESSLQSPPPPNTCETLQQSLLHLFFSSSPSFPLPCAPHLLWEHSNVLPLCTLSYSPSNPPTPCPESGRPQRHHSPLGDNRYKEGLGGLVAAAQCASPLGKDWRKVSRLSQSPPVLISTSSDDENSVSED